MTRKNRGFRRTTILSWLPLTLAALSLVSANALAQDAGFVLQSAAKEKVAAAVRAMGGTVTYKYENIDALAVSIPADRRADLFSIEGVDAVYKDQFVRAPEPMEKAAVDAADILATVHGSDALGELSEAPAGFLHHLSATGADQLIFGEGLSGAGVLVAVIDSGTAEVPAIFGRVVGGENFVPGTGEPSATSTANEGHGTEVATTMAADVLYCFGNTSTMVQSLLTHAPGSVIPEEFLPPGFCPAGASLVPMVGTAPAAEVYALKVFPASGGGAPDSRIIEAMDRAITIRKNYNNGMPYAPVSGTGTEDDPFVYDAAPIEVVNMSVGGPTLFAGRDLGDQLTEAMLDVGITLIAAAGNEGFAAMTGGSPGTGMGSLTSGAASLAANERVLRDLQFGLGIGGFYRASTHTQVAEFSSRGPTADGRIDPDNVSSGFAVLAQSADGGLAVVSGTSFSAPSTAGGAALLREADPTASAAAIRNALVRTSNPFVIPGAAPVDQGTGFVDFVAALGYLPDADEYRHGGEHRHPSSLVRNNVRRAGFKPIRLRGGSKTVSLTDLIPGEVAHVFVESSAWTDALRFEFRNITPDLPPDQQNLFFGDDVFVKVQDALTSDEVTQFGGFLSSDTTVDIDNPQTGLVRLAVMGDWTNAGSVSVDVTITESAGWQGRPTEAGRVAQGESDVFSVEVPDGTSEAVFELSWPKNWARYPTNDLDLILLDPLGGVYFEGATLDSPERVVVADAPAGEWTVVVDGFTIHGKHQYKPAASPWFLRVTADGKRLRTRPHHPSSADDD